jgi:hypothetical protein
MKTAGFAGRHYETGTIVNALAVIGAGDYDEALTLGASGGIAFGNFVFEYKGYLPHVALLTRNTFSPFDRTLDNLAVRRDVRETTDAARAEKNLQAELDSGNAVIVWADAYSLPYTGLSGQQMWSMQPMLVVGREGDDFLVVDKSRTAFPVSASDLSTARGRVKKDRFRMMTLEAPDKVGLRDGLIRGIETCLALFLDKPPAGSPNNFGFTGMRHFAGLLTDDKTAKGWGRVFPRGPKLVQALAGAWGQPGIADWIERWGTSDRADRDTYADFLVQASELTDIAGIAAAAEPLRRSAAVWRRMADESMPDSIPEMARLKVLKRKHGKLRFETPLESIDERAAIRAEMARLTEALATSPALAEASSSIRTTLANLIEEVIAIEEPAITQLRAVVNG